MAVGLPFRRPAKDWSYDASVVGRLQIAAQSAPYGASAGNFAAGKPGT